MNHYCEYIPGEIREEGNSQVRDAIDVTSHAPATAGDRRKLLGREVYMSPEFKALCERFGITHRPRKNFSITLRIACGEAFLVTEEYYGDTDRKKE